MTNLPGWAQEATLGIFIHWGAYSVPAWAEPSGALGAVPEEEWFAHNAYAEWYANTIRIEESPAAQHHRRGYGGAPYADFLDDWHAESYDPADWARLFSAVGADYVVPTTKHHDGIALWSAPGSTGLNTVERGPQRDLIAPLADAVRAEGMRFGVYYSGGLDWSFTDFPPIRSNAELLRFRPTDADYNAYAFGHVADLIDRYRPDVLWNDIEWPDAGKVPGPHSLQSLVERYRAAVPGGIVNDRWGADVWDYRTSEYDTGAGHEAGTGWEHCRGLGFSFGYNRLEDESLTLTPRELARLYADIVSRAGRLLLNVGPTAAGEIPAVQRRTLEGVAEWMGAIKPLTIGRRLLGDDRRAELEVSGTKWWRAWETSDGIVVVIDGPAASARLRSDRPVTVVSLPD
ncbi:alpha-L-fucosidase [Agromyces albus]|uniref:alpha-L-fucosidase n=1 Tax=Agromyces albus TaxID=205332 RepID=A0A4Q2KT30_9MICO|nr:alpha-L-fucosidase [Agromyces albus]RXZ68645.1 alpha-L-fucosidase [Agromyces albus]